MEIDWTRHIVIALVAALGVAALTVWGSTAPPDQKGWRQIAPGATYLFAIGLGTVLTLGMAWVWLFVGSSRPDGASQMRILFWLIAAFALGTLITLFQYRQARRTALRWRGDALVWRGPGGAEQRRQLSEAAALRRPFMGPVFVVFEDGIEARIDPYAANAPALIETLAERLYPDVD